MLVINPDECIDCGVCEPECPAGAIVADTQLGGESTDWVELKMQSIVNYETLQQSKRSHVDADSSQSQRRLYWWQ